MASPLSLHAAPARCMAPGHASTTTPTPRPTLPTCCCSSGRAHLASTSATSTSASTSSASSRLRGAALVGSRRGALLVRAAGNGDQPQADKPVKYNKEFGYSRKDVTIITFGLFGLGYALYYGLQATGMDAGMAGNWVQLIIFMGICVGWVSTYLYRVATKQMTYVKQLEQYEEAVMRKRVEEMTEDELAELMQQAEASRKPGPK